MSRFGVVLDEDFTKYVEKVKSDSEHLIKSVFVEKVKSLNAVLASPVFASRKLSSVHQEISIPVPNVDEINRSLRNNGHEEESKGAKSKKRKLDDDPAPAQVFDQIEGTKVYALKNGTVPCNNHILSVLEIVKPEIREIVEHTNKLRTWITLLIPKIEDGNNFGVSIQEDTLEEIRGVETEAATSLEQITRYHLARGKYLSKVAKYPHIADYRQLIVELDEKEFLSLRLILLEIRNHYASLYDLIIKNWEKIIKPRNSNSENLY